jgi:hypothetical protein
MAEYLIHGIEVQRLKAHACAKAEKKRKQEKYNQAKSRSAHVSKMELQF